MKDPEIPKRITEITGYKARWASPIFEYDGCERTIEIFRVPLELQIGVLKELRDLRQAAGPLVFVFREAP